MFLEVGDNLKVAYLEFVKSRGKTYVYVVEYVGVDQREKRKERRIMGLGTLKSAKKQIEEWKKDNSKMPDEIKSEETSVIDYWLESVKNRGAY